MAWPKGRPRPPGAGRKKGTPNKIVHDLNALCEEEGIDPFRAMLKLARESPDLNVKLGSLKEILKYIHPQRKAIEHSGEIANPYTAMSIDQLEELIKDKLK